MAAKAAAGFTQGHALVGGSHAEASLQEKSEATPKVSVVIPTHNRADLLPGAVRSVLQQSFQDFELIIVDDASADDTQRVVLEFGDPRIRYIRHDTNRGVAAARNRGIEAARGEYIAFLDDDDEWLVDKLRQQVRMLDESGSRVGGVYTGFRQIDRATGRSVYEVRHKRAVSILSELRAHNCVGTASTVVVRKSCFDEVGLFDESVAFGEEYDMWIRLAQRYDFRCIREVLVRYFVHDLRLTNSAAVRIDGLVRQLEKHGEFFRTDRANYSRRYRMLGMLYADLHDVRKARAAFRRALAADPLSLGNYMYWLVAYLQAADDRPALSPSRSTRVYDRFSYRRRVLRAVGSRVPPLRAVYRRLASETRMVYYASRNGLWRVARERWRSAGRPVQATLQWRVELGLPADLDLPAMLQARGIAFSQGGHAVYVPPQPGLRDVLGEMVSFYPSGAGYKILKNLKGPSEARYLGDLRVSTLTQSAIVGKAGDLIPVANVLSDLGIAPRLYDVAAIATGGMTLTVFVVEHIPGHEPIEADCRRFLANLRKLTAERMVTLAAAAWERSEDFRCPGCSGNLLTSEIDGSTKYVDFQNFLIPDYDAYLRRLVQGARQDAHFGDEYALRGGRYLYQQVPGLGIKGSRDTSLRWERIQKMLREGGGGVEGRLVLDIGCNMGMVLAAALANGAMWGIGWDREKVVKHSRKLLSALGYTRWDLVGTNLSKEYSVEKDVPERLTHLLPEAVVFYLAIRHHIGFLDSLASLPWRFLVYEGAQEEMDGSFERIARELCSLAGCERVDWHGFSDGDSAPRPLAIFRRTAT